MREWRARRSASCRSDPLHLLQFDRDQRMHEFLHVAAENRDLANQCRRDEGELFLRREEYGLQIPMQVPAHVGELELELEIRNRAQTTHHDLHTVFARE